VYRGERGSGKMNGNLYYTLYATYNIAIWSNRIFITFLPTCRRVWLLVMDKR